MLDIIVSIIPMLLLSVVFVRVMMVETPVPQVVEKAIAAAQEQSDLPSVSLIVSKAEGFRLVVVEKGSRSEREIPTQGGGFDYDRLYQETLALKRAHPQVFKMEISPDPGVDLTEIVRTIDRVRVMSKSDGEIQFKDVATGENLNTNLMFPHVSFGNITGG
jgi:hypothetical protein